RESLSANHNSKRERGSNAGAGLILANASGYEEYLPGSRRRTTSDLLNTNAADDGPKSVSEKGPDPLRRGQKSSEIDSPSMGQTPFRIGSHVDAGTIKVSDSNVLSL